MHIPRHLTRLIISFGAIWLMFPDMVYAYIDPGTGSYMLQLLIGAVLGGSFVVKLYWRRIKARLFGRSADRDRGNGTDEQDDQ